MRNNSIFKFFSYGFVWEHPNKTKLIKKNLTKPNQLNHMKPNMLKINQAGPNQRKQNKIGLNQNKL